MAYNASEDPWYIMNLFKWYEYFSKNGQNQGLFLVCFFGIRALYATVGFLCNVATVDVTLRNKSLHGTCNILIAMDCFLSAFDNASYYISFLVVATGVRFIPYQQCFWTIIIPDLCGDGAQLLMIFTGLERLLAVLCPIWYKKRAKAHFLAIMAILLTIYWFCDFAIIYLDHLPALDVMVHCSGNDVGQTTQFGSMMRVRNLVFSGMIMVIYGLIWIVVFFVPSIKNAVNADNRRLILALLIVIFMNLFGVFFRSCVTLGFYHTRPNVFIKGITSEAMSFLIISVFSSNGPVLYLMSKNYRDKFNQRHKWLPKKLHSVSSMTNNNTTAAAAAVARTATRTGALRQNFVQN